MPINRSRISSSAFVVALLCAGSSTLLAQTSRPWVDPPSETGASPAPPAAQPQAPQEPAVPTASSTQPGQRVPMSPGGYETKQATQPPQAKQPAVTAEPQTVPDANPQPSRTAQAKAFAIDYLESWSARNDLALEDTAEFYAPRVLFHGRTISLERLYKEKSRFARRWPERDYRPRHDAIGSQCNPAGNICTVHLVFDYVAGNPARRRVSEGSGALQLVVQFIGEKPVIVAEHSTLLNQTRKRKLALEDASHE